MKVAFFVSSLNYGGAEKQTVLDANLICPARESYIENIYFLYFQNGPLKTLLNDGIIDIKIAKKSYLFTAYKLSRIIKRKKIDLIHASLFAPMTISALSSIFAPVKIVWHFHSHEYDIPFKSRLSFRILAKFPAVRKILFVNNELMEHFSSLRFPLAKQGVLYNHSEIELRPPDNEKTGDMINIGYLGRVIGLKRISYLIDLAVYLIDDKNFSGFIIHIVGDGDILEEIKRKVENTDLTRFFKFHGFQEDVAKYYRQFDLFVNPSSEECLCMAMIDAGMAGVPTVAFDVGGNNEIVINDHTGYIVRDKNSFFSKCFELIQDPLKRKRFGLNSQRHCNKHFGREKHIRDIQRLNREIFA